MPKANPKAWFPGQIAKINYRSVDKWALRMQHLKPYFPTWKEAHDWMLARADEQLKRAQKELKSATAHRMKVKAMEDPKP